MYSSRDRNVCKNTTNHLLLNDGYRSNSPIYIYFNNVGLSSGFEVDFPDYKYNLYLLDVHPLLGIGSVLRCDCSPNSGHALDDASTVKVSLDEIQFFNNFASLTFFASLILLFKIAVLTSLEMRIGPGRLLETKNFSP